ncbi:sortase [Candidatus Saccharibacteria bacterium]|nr:sortase [Candidatus Saccharibacteria bacterium]
MEIRRRRFDFRKIVTLFYVAAFTTYLILGFQPAEATHYEISGSLNIPSIGLVSDVTTLELKDRKLDTPNTIVGSYTRYDSKIFLIGHSTTVFKNLNQVKVGSIIEYNGKKYQIVDTKTLAKSEIDMNILLAPEAHNTLVIMTCAGEILENQDATHRFIVTALEA